MDQTQWTTSPASPWIHVAELKSNTPELNNLLSHLARCERFGEGEIASDRERIATLRSTTAICTLLKARSVKVLGPQLLLSFMLIARAINKQVRGNKSTVLIHAGVCVSYATAWKLVPAANYSRGHVLESIREGH
jgi:hypothetical protein